MTIGTGTAPRIESADLNLANLFKDFYTVPDFQREYVWKHENVERLLQDIYDEFYDEPGHITHGPEYFIGSIVVCSDDDGTYQLIDGQQRLTTCYLILCAIRDALAETGTSSLDTLQSQIADTSMNPHMGDDVFRYRLTLQYQDSDGVLEKIASSAVEITAIPVTTASVRHLRDAYGTICGGLHPPREAHPHRDPESLARAQGLRDDQRSRRWAQCHGPSEEFALHEDGKCRLPKAQRSLEDALSEAIQVASIAYSVDTTDSEKEAANLRFASEILPRMEEQRVRLSQAGPTLKNPPIPTIR